MDRATQSQLTKGSQNVFDELKRYTAFSANDEENLRAVASYVLPHADRIAEMFYERVDAHAAASAVIADAAQRARLRAALVQWMRDCFEGPWAAAYYGKRCAIGRVHLRIGLDQRYMFGAMDVVRLEIQKCLQSAVVDIDLRTRAIASVDKLLDIELGIMLESYREAFLALLEQDAARQRMSLEARLAVADARYDQIVESSDALIVTMDQDGIIQLFNRACEEVTGISRHEAPGRHWIDIFDRNGQRDAAPQIWQAAHDKTSFADTDVLGIRGMRRIRWQFSRLPSGDNHLTCALGVDMTERLELAERARRAERLADLGATAAGFAHEVRNPINAASLQCQVLKRRLAKLEAADAREAEPVIEIVLSELKRVEALLGEFLRFSKPRAIVKRPTDLSFVVRSVVEMLLAKADVDGVTLDVSLPQRAVASVDEDSIKQVVHNLVRNGLEACERGGRVHVALDIEGDDAVIRVNDTGKGLPPGDKDRLFQPFVTTKENGTGLGLAIVHRIVTDHKGSIDVTSRPGSTSFTVRISVDVDTGKH